MTDELRTALLGLHKQLVEYAKSEYVKTHGPVAGPAAMFKLLVEEPSFQWLRPLSETIVAIDEALETNPPASHQAIVEMVHNRLLPAQMNDFSKGLEGAIASHEGSKDAYQIVRSFMV